MKTRHKNMIWMATSITLMLIGMKITTLQNDNSFVIGIVIAWIGVIMFLLKWLDPI
jgi:uncharacterized Tic20 family protein